MHNDSTLRRAEAAGAAVPNIVYARFRRRWFAQGAITLYNWGISCNFIAEPPVMVLGVKRAKGGRALYLHFGPFAFWFGRQLKVIRAYLADEIAAMQAKGAKLPQ